MGFMGKIKQMFGIGGVKVQCTPSTTDISSNGGSVDGRVEKARVAESRRRGRRGMSFAVGQ